MARGLAVLQAAIEGRRVRMVGEEDSHWKRWNGYAFHAECACQPAELLGLHVFFDREWEIEPARGLTFAEASLAMDAGMVVEVPVGDDMWMQWRLYREHGEWGYEWRQRVGAARIGTWHRDGATFGYAAIHSSEWRVVDEGSADARPTVQDLREWFAGCLATDDGGAMWEVRETAQRFRHAPADALAARWPAMFREEETP